MTLKVLYKSVEDISDLIRITWRVNMPSSIRTKQMMKKREVPVLRVPQARVLKALMPREENTDPIDWPVYTRAQLNVRVGYSPISTGITRPLRGIAEGSSSGDPHPGLIDLRCVEEVKLDIDGITETNYRITPLGVAAFRKYVEENGDNLPELKEAASCTNKRYVKSDHFLDYLAR